MEGCLLEGRLFSTRSMTNSTPRFIRTRPLPAAPRACTPPVASTHPQGRGLPFFPACSLEDLLSPELRAGPKYAGLSLPRAALVLDKYKEVDKASGLKAMHKSKQAEVRAWWGGGMVRRGRRESGSDERESGRDGVMRCDRAFAKLLFSIPPIFHLQRFISRKTVERVLKELREGGSRPASRASSSTGSMSGMGPRPS